MHTRRQFLQHASLGAAAVSVPSIHMGKRRSDDLRVGVAGVRGRGGNLMNGAEALDGVSVVAFCDVDASILAKRASDMGAKWGREIATFTDFRNMVRNADIDAVLIATPNHLHAIHMIWAVEAGKDVYVEKPVSHNLSEGGVMLAAAEKYGRVVQTGTQSRSSGALRDAIAWLDSGAIGKKTHGWGTCFKPRPSIGKVTEAQPIPESIDWKLYMGPRGERPLTRGQVHYDWHWQFPTGNGDLGNQGVHQVDQLRWALGLDSLPKSALSIGGRMGYDDDGDTPNTMLTYFDYPETPILFEVRGLPSSEAARGKMDSWRGSMDRRLGSAVGAVIHAEGGYLRFPNYSSARAYDRSGAEIKKWDGADNHMQNFVDAVRSADRGAVNAPLRDGDLSASLCHMGNDSYATGMSADRGSIERMAASSPMLGHAVDRMLGHLDANGVDLRATALTVGASLGLAADGRSYVDHDAANLRAAGEYVEGFELPKFA